MKKIRFKPDYYIEHEGRQILEYICKATEEDIISAYSRDRTKTGQIPVYCLNLDDSIGAYYRSISEAHRETGINQSNISRALKNNTFTAGGFKWIKASKYIV